MGTSWIFNQAASKTVCYISTFPEFCLFLLALHCILNNLTMDSMNKTFQVRSILFWAKIDRNYGKRGIFQYLIGKAVGMADKEAEIA